MAFSVVMPALEMAQETGKLLAWRKKEGESVAKGEPLLEVETDKAVLEIEAPADGVLAGVKVHEGAVVPVGHTIAWILRPGEVPPAEGAGMPDPGGPAPGEPPRPASTSADAAEERPATDSRMSPKARRLARERGVDVTRLRGSGPGGEVLASDVLAAETRAAFVPAGLETLGPVGRLMAERTAQSWTSVPHFFVVREVDAGAFRQARERLGAAISPGRGLRLTHTDVLVALVARVLVRHPRLNASWAGEGIRLNPEVNLAIAIAVEEGVVAAVIPKANTADLASIAAKRQELSERAKAGRLRPSDIADGTFTISNLGMYHVDAFSAIINPPQAAILAVGAIADRVVPVDGAPGIRPMMTLTLSCDHRVVDGAGAAAFLHELAEAIREPERLLP
jgi:pyruvate dehydrogenase E2 component (dihydrolipoyllysine-residue acetyltransferase)